MLNRVKLSLQFQNYKQGEKQRKADVLNRVKLSLQFQNYKQGEKQRKVSGWEICTKHQQCRVQNSSMVSFSFGPLLLHKMFLVCDPWNNGLVFQASSQVVDVKEKYGPYRQSLCCSDGFLMTKCFIFFFKAIDISAAFHLVWVIKRVKLLDKFRPKKCFFILFLQCKDLDSPAFTINGKWNAEGLDIKKGDAMHFHTFIAIDMN